MSEDLTSDFNQAHGALDPERIAALPAPLELDHAKYRKDIEDFGLSEAQEREFLETLWSIMRTFVELGFDAQTCAQLLESFNAVAEQTQDIVE